MIYGFVNGRVVAAFMVLEMLTPPAQQVTVDDCNCAASYLSAVRVSVLPVRTEILYKEGTPAEDHDLMSDVLAEALVEFRQHHNSIRGVGWVFFEDSNLGMDMFNILDSDFNVRQQKWPSKFKPKPKPKPLVLITTMDNYQINSLTYH